MLKKLLKYDMKFMARLLVGVDISCVVIATVFSLFFMKMSDIIPDFEIFSPLVTTFVYFPVMFLVMLVSVAATQVVVMVRIYKNMFSCEGYLTFTLPATNGELLASKIISSSIWVFFSAVVMALCVYMMYTPALDVIRAEAAQIEGLSSVTDSIIDSLKAGISPVGAAIYCVFLGVVVSVYDSVCSLFAFSIAQLSKKSRIIAGIASYLLVTEAVTIVDLLLGALNFVIFGKLAALLLQIPIVVIAATVLYFVLTRKLTTKKLNLV